MPLFKATHTPSDSVNWFATQILTAVHMGFIPALGLLLAMMCAGAHATRSATGRPAEATARLRRVTGGPAVAAPVLVRDGVPVGHGRRFCAGAVHDRGA